MVVGEFTYATSSFPRYLVSRWQAVDITPIVVRKEEGHIFGRIKAGVIVRRDLLVKGPDLCLWVSRFTLPTWRESRTHGSQHQVRHDTFR